METLTRKPRLQEREAFRLTFFPEGFRVRIARYVDVIVTHSFKSKSLFVSSSSQRRMVTPRRSPTALVLKSTKYLHTSTEPLGANRQADLKHGGKARQLRASAFVFKAVSDPSGICQGNGRQRGGNPKLARGWVLVLLKV